MNKCDWDPGQDHKLKLHKINNQYDRAVLFGIVNPRRMEFIMVSAD